MKKQKLRRTPTVIKRTAKTKPQLNKEHKDKDKEERTRASQSKVITLKAVSASRKTRPTSSQPHKHQKPTMSRPLLRVQPSINLAQTMAISRLKASRTSPSSTFHWRSSSSASTSTGSSSRCVSTKSSCRNRKNEWDESQSMKIRHKSIRI